MNYLISSFLILSYLHTLTESRSTHLFNHPGDILQHPPPFPEELSSIERTKHRSQHRHQGHKSRRPKDDCEDESNEIDLKHANFEDSELVSDLNSNVIFEKDRDIEIVQGDILITKSEHERVRRGAVKPPNKLWPDGVIFYDFAPNLGQLKVQLVLSAMQHIMDYTCIKFERRLDNSTDYLNITSETGCYSWVGKQGGAQHVSVGSGCVTMGIIAHELAHAIGFYHEQSRPDRDDYVELIEENIKHSQLDNFQKRHTTEVDSLDVPYDYGSIMHYGLRDFSENKLPTLKTLRPVPPGVQIGQRVRLSDQDIEQANKLYKCPDNRVFPSSNDRTRRPNRGVFDTLNSLMIVGGNQDTTEPLCLDGMTYKGNQVLVTMCSNTKGTLKWVWTDDYQLKNVANGLCLSVQDNHTAGNSENVAIKMSECKPRDDLQKWICTAGFLKNLALNKCINSTWKPYRRNSNMIAVSTCDTSNRNQVMSVYGMGKRYEPVCRKWNIRPQFECSQRFTQSFERSYLGCEHDKAQAMIGFEKVGNRNNLKAIRSVDCCQLTNSTGSVYRTSMKTIFHKGSTECHDGYFVQGLGLARAKPGIRLHKIKERSLNALAYLHCVKPSDHIAYDQCYWDDLRSRTNNKGMNVCSRGGFYMTGLYKKGCSRLSCILRIKCCSVNLHSNYT